ncbi:MAG: hypothetical protein KDI07_10505 [Anaerolineae bacterium]|nr:hypothetical protein [Anaerolineae bacterium]MCB9132730.1 hypothetical protein [Anaerolineales bacterium]MCB0229625.1 hypothetical protein [Anaerolineae bacterium]MCB0235720.1 hypothetical protein [Anaerolineae bacterium]MCB0237095.1 hypothetical protein [Anaerolineae bacterium]
MPALNDAATRVDRVLYGEPVQIGGYELQAQARLTGWAGGMEADGGGGGGAWLKLTPTAFHVRDHDGGETMVPITDPQAAAMRGMAMPAAIVAVMSVVLMVVVRLWRAR